MAGESDSVLSAPQTHLLPQSQYRYVVQMKLQEILATSRTLTDRGRAIPCSFIETHER